MLFSLYFQNYLKLENETRSQENENEMKWIKFFVGKSSIYWAKFELQKMVLFHFLFECSSENTRLYFYFFHLVSINFFSSLASKWNRKYIVFILLQIFHFASNIFSSIFASNSLFRAANLRKMTCSYCSNCIYVTQISIVIDRSI